MIEKERQTLLSEALELTEILDSIPEDNVVERASFATRLRRVSIALEEIHGDAGVDESTGTSG